MDTQDLHLTKKEMAMLYFPEGLYEIYEKKINGIEHVNKFIDKVIKICKEFVYQLAKDTDFKFTRVSSKIYEIGVYFTRNESTEDYYFIGLDPQAVIQEGMPENFIFQIDVCVKKKGFNNTFLMPIDIYTLIDSHVNPINYWYCKSLDRKLLINLDNEEKKDEFFKTAKNSLNELLIWVSNHV